MNDTGLRYIITINIKKFTLRYKQLCGCEVCVQTKQLQCTLNAWRKTYSNDNPSYKIIVLSNNMILHPKPKDAIEKIICLYISLGKYYVIVYYFILDQLIIINFFK